MIHTKNKKKINIKMLYNKLENLILGDLGTLILKVIFFCVRFSMYGVSIQSYTTRDILTGQTNYIYSIQE